MPVSSADFSSADLPPADRLYAAFLARDPGYEGQVLVGVQTTGIYCRLTCPARKPRPENCRWFRSADQAEAAGFRPCRRCHPDQATEAEGKAAITDLMAALRADPAFPWSEAALTERGHDPSTIRRLFRHHFGRSFLAIAREQRLKAGMASLQAGEAVITAQLEAGFDSASGFRNAFSRLFGHAPARMRKGDGALADWIETPLGGMIAVADQQALHLLEFTDRKELATGLRRLSVILGGQIGLGRTAIHDRTEAELARYFAAELSGFTVNFVLHGTDFQRAVWRALCQIPAGETRSYAELAASIGRPRAVRAVAATNGRNRLAILVPCHRVIGADGSLTGYAGGLWRKQRLIEIERDLGQARLAL